MSRKPKKRPGVPSGVMRPARWEPARADPPRERKLHRYCVVRLVRPKNETRDPRWRGDDHYEVQIGPRSVRVPLPVQSDADGPVPLWRSENPQKRGLSLKVGRHDKRLGVVFLVRTEKKAGPSRYHRARGHEHGARERGLVEWDGKTVKSLVRAAAGLALHYAGVSDPPPAVLEALGREFAKLGMWKDLAGRSQLGEKLEVVRDVMLT